jgi:pyruvate/2-oxoacid:ferredoxin oxidoreductase alpha subunit
MEDADIVLISMGTTASTVRTAVDRARERGVRAGALRIRMFRPLPEETLRTYLERATRVGVLDRDLCPGLGGIVWSEVRPLVARDAVCQGYMLGLGGGDIRPEHIAHVLDDLAARDGAGAPVMMEVG